MAKHLKEIGTLVYIIANVYLCLGYIGELIDYFSGTYNYDGFRYIVPIFFGDIVSLIGLVILYFVLGLKKDFYYLIGLTIMNNIAICTGIEYIPFVGSIFCFLSISISLRIGFNKQKGKSEPH